MQNTGWASVNENDRAIKIETDKLKAIIRNDTPGCIRHEKGDTFSEIYLSYLSGPNGVRIPSVVSSNLSIAT